MSLRRPEVPGVDARAVASSGVGSFVDRSPGRWRSSPDSQLTTVQAIQMKANLATDVAGVKPRPFAAATTVKGFTKCW